MGFLQVRGIRSDDLSNVLWRDQNEVSQDDLYITYALTWTDHNHLDNINIHPERSSRV